MLCITFPNGKANLVWAKGREPFRNPESVAKQRASQSENGSVTPCHLRIALLTASEKNPHPRSKKPQLTSIMKNFVYVHFMKCNSWGRGNIVRKGKFSGRSGGVAGLWMHDMRVIETKNANPKKLHYNAIICKETNWKPVRLSNENIEKLGCNDPEFVAKRAKQLLLDKKINARPDSVKVAAFILHSSPQFLRDGTDDGKLNREKVQTWAAGTIEYLQRKYGERLITAMIHMDESNPHMSAYVVPLIEKYVKKRGPKAKGMKGKPPEATLKLCLSAKEMFTPDEVIMKVDEKTKEEILEKVIPGTCSLMQDEYAETLQEYGLDVRRGVKKPILHRGIKHEVNMDLYVRRTNPVAHVKSLSPAELLDWAVVAAPTAEDAARAKKERDYYQVSAADAQKKAASLEQVIEDSQRELPIGDVIKRLMGLDPISPDKDPSGPGSPPEPGAPKKRKDIQMEFLMPNGMRIGVNNQNGFENLTPEIPFKGKNSKRLRGKGPLDAIMFLNDWTFKAASEWLADNYSTEEATKSIATKYAENLAFDPDDHGRIMRKDHAATVARDLETPDDSQWESVRQTLFRTNKFRKAVIDSQHEANWIDANRYGHLVFTKGNWDENGYIVTTGKIIVDPKNPTVTLKEIGDNGLYFDIDQQATKVVICSSPMDALAIRSSQEHYASTVVVVGKSLNEKTIAALEYVIKKHRGKKILAESISSAGRKLAAWMLEHFPAIETLPLPKGVENWLDYQKRPRLESDPADLRVVEFPKKNQANPDDMAME